jgi:hypothetical protein
MNELPLELSSTISGQPVIGRCCGWSSHGVFAFASSSTVSLSVRSPRESDQTMRLPPTNRVREIRWQKEILPDHYPATSFLAVRSSNVLLFYRVSRAGDRCFCASGDAIAVSIEGKEDSEPIHLIRSFCWVKSSTVLMSSATSLYAYSVPSVSEASSNQVKLVSVRKPLFTFELGQVTAIQVADDCTTVACGFSHGLITLFHFDGISLTFVQNVDLVRSSITEMLFSMRPNRRGLDLFVATHFAVLILSGEDNVSTVCAVYDNCKGVTSFVPFPRTGSDFLCLPMLAVAPNGVHGIFGASCTKMISCSPVLGNFKRGGVCHICDLVFHDSLSLLALVCQCARGHVRLFVFSAEDPRVSPLINFVSLYKVSEQIDETMPLWILRNTENALDFFATEIVFPAFPSPLLSHYHEQRLTVSLTERVLAWNAIREVYLRQRLQSGVNFFLEPHIDGIQRWKLLLIQLLRLQRTRQLVSELLLGQAVSLFYAWKRNTAREGFRPEGALCYIRLYTAAPLTETWGEPLLIQQLEHLLHVENPPAAIGFGCSVCQSLHNVEMTLSLISVSTVDGGDNHTTYFDPNLFNSISLYEEQELLSSCKECGLYSFVTRATCDLCCGLLL